MRKTVAVPSQWPLKQPGLERGEGSQLERRGRGMTCFPWKPVGREERCRTWWPWCWAVGLCERESRSGQVVSVTRGSRSSEALSVSLGVLTPSAQLHAMQHLPFQRRLLSQEGNSSFVDCFASFRVVIEPEYFLKS